jgi:hypothetical protein
MNDILWKLIAGMHMACFLNCAMHALLAGSMLLV